MSKEKKENTTGASAEQDFAKAFQEIARGERTATALENHLDSLEKNIEDLLAKADEDERNLQAQAQTQSKSSSTEPSANDKKTTSS
ncbi:hypothetical protein DM02DRAFT_655602 [Periconia macrospinosa]|uniref:Uncharacterized protein n=1 Tax=Periconia macrospinosa TaxID=97972 RepID=A0A2V1DST2_9PLEO|nr:hypothetical protein DM02DRAFT_655602 [Periconia macrospinosa]